MNLKNKTEKLDILLREDGTKEGEANNITYITHVHSSRSCTC